MTAIGTFYDQVIVHVDIPGVPEFVEKTMVRPTVRKMILDSVSGMIDGLVAILNRTGWFDTPGVNGAKPTIDGNPTRALGFAPYTP